MLTCAEVTTAEETCDPVFSSTAKALDENVTFPDEAAVKVYVKEAAPPPGINAAAGVAAGDAEPVPDMPGAKGSAVRASALPVFETSILTVINWPVETTKGRAFMYAVSAAGVSTDTLFESR